MIDTLSPDAVPYSSAGLRQAGISPAPSGATLHRWRLKGLRGVRMCTFLRGGRRYVERSALAEFFENVTTAADGSNRRTCVQSTTSQRSRAIKAAEAELDSDGI